MATCDSHTDIYPSIKGPSALSTLTASQKLELEIPQVREAAEPFVSKLFPCSAKVLRTEPLRAMVIGAFVRGLSMRDGGERRLASIRR